MSTNCRSHSYHGPGKCPGCVNCGPPIVVKADEGCGEGCDREVTDADLKLVLGRTEAGDECPLCQCGTVEIVSEVAGTKGARFSGHGILLCLGKLPERRKRHI